MSEFDWHTIEPFENEYAVYGHGTYEESSVLAGQYRRCFLEVYDTEAEAIAQYPEAQVEEGSTKVFADMATGMSDMAPSWFDPADAGEEW